MDQWGPKHVELTYVMNKTQSLKNFVYLVGLHIYYEMIHGPYSIKFWMLLCESKCPDDNVLTFANRWLPYEYTTHIYMYFFL